MTKDISRAQFLRGDFGATRKAVRPPWALDEPNFVDTCRRGGDCISACPEKILVKGRGGFPQVDFAAGECTFCGDCAKTCKSGALAYMENRPPWLLKVRIEPSCLALKQVVCHTCGESCPTGAIRFRLAVGMVARPEVDLAACTGCGACLAPCPVSALTIDEIVAEQTA
ncbi:MAG: ferredoxin-type protein NapF [Sulfuricella sp.]